MKLSKPRFILNSVIIGITSIIALMLTMHLSLFIDESFTMSLIRHSYRSIIQLDSLDVHPPLYYLVLKLFLSVLTLGHQNLITDIILARLFSFLCFIISFIVMLQVLRVMKIRYNVSILYVILTIFMLWVQEVTDIRMYPLAILLVVLEFFNVVKYIDTHNNKYIVAVTIFAILSAYTHYYAAIIAGLFILLPFIHDLVHRSRNALKWLIVGIIFLIAYLPWLRIFFKQTVDMPGHYWILMSWTFRDSLEFIVILLLSYPVLRQINRLDKDQVIYKLIMNVCIIMLLMELILSIHKPIFILRYVSPLLFIYIAVTFGILDNIYRNRRSHNKYLEALIVIFMVIVGADCVYTNVQSQKQFHHQSMMLVSHFSNRNHHFVHLNLQKATQGNVRHLCQFNTYAQYTHNSLSRRELSIIISKKLKQGTSSELMGKVWKTR